jgi:hypothetical protein
VNAGLYRIHPSHSSAMWCGSLQFRDVSVLWRYALISLIYLSVLFALEWIGAIVNVNVVALLHISSQQPPSPRRGRRK